MRIVTADLCDAAGPAVRVAAPVFEAFGGRAAFGGAVCTLRVYEDNSLVRETLQTPGDGRVLVVDGGGSLRCALLGGNLAELAVNNEWAGVVINGCVRDRLEIDALPVGVRALASVPLASQKRNSGERDVELHFACIDIRPGDFLYADEDGLIVSATDLLEGGSGS